MGCHITAQFYRYDYFTGKGFTIPEQIKHIGNQTGGRVFLFLT